MPFVVGQVKVDLVDFSGQWCLHTFWTRSLVTFWTCLCGGPRWWWCESASCADLLVGRETQLADQLSKFVFAQLVLNAVVGKSMIC